MMFVMPGQVRYDEFGPFTIASIMGAGNLHAGCHEFAILGINKFTKLFAKNIGAETQGIFAAGIG